MTDLATRVREEHRRHRNRRSEPLDPRAMREALTEAEAAVAMAQGTRAQLRGRTIPGEAEREATIEAALAMLGAAAKPLRREVARFATDPARERRWGADVRRQSAAIQRERRKLWKMRKKGSA